MWGRANGMKTLCRLKSAGLSPPLHRTAPEPPAIFAGKKKAAPLTPPLHVFLFACRWAGLGLSKFLFKFRHRIEQIGNKAKICHLEDWCLVILVDGDNHFAVFHAS